jgi:DNA-binding response OmpR family regulator
MSLRLLIADDTPDLAHIVAVGARLIWPDCAVTTAPDGATALERFAAERPDLVVLDVSIPPPDGFEVCARIRAVSNVPILMLTVRDSTLDKVRALDLGADDYLTKPFDHLELLARLRALMRRSTGLSTTAPLVESGQLPVFVLGEFTLNFAIREVCIGYQVISLTSTEYRLLEELVRNAGITLTHSQLLERVWGPEYMNEITYPKVFVQRLRQKLGDDPQHPRYIHTEWGIGYRFTAPG